MIRPLIKESGEVLDEKLLRTATPLFFLAFLPFIKESSRFLRASRKPASRFPQESCRFLSFIKNEGRHL